MAYDRDKILKQLIDNIHADEDITTFEDAALTVEPTRQCLYNWEFDKIDDIKEAIASNKVKVKNFLRKQWREGNPTLQLALYKLLSTATERKALSMEYKEHSGSVNLPKLQVEVVSNESK
jgi:hypothetical protein